MSPILHKIFLLRHGETVWNTEKRLQGVLDSPLTSRGREQVKMYGAWLRNVLQGQPIQLVSSPLPRCQTSASIIAPMLELTPAAITVDDRLRELSFGDWQGQKVDDIITTDALRYYSREADLWEVAAPQGESFRDASIRLGSWLSDNRRTTIVVISHGCVGQILRGLHADMNSKQITALDHRHGIIYVLGLGGGIESVAVADHINIAV